MKNILISGINGFMGREVVSIIENNPDKYTVIAGVDLNANHPKYPVFNSFEEVEKSEIAGKIDCVIDFSHHSLTKSVCNFAINTNIPVVLATTGQTEEEKEYIKASSYSATIFYSANMALGVALLVNLAKKAAAAFPDADIEIVETHHNRKIDAPSGTALMIFDGIKEVRPNAVKNEGRSGNAKRQKDEIGINAIRRGNIVGIHEVIVSTNTQAITLKHEAYTRALFADGAITACDYVVGKQNGLYNMNTMVED